jgi:hypothetical protein
LIEAIHAASEPCSSYIAAHEINNNMLLLSLEGFREALHMKPLKIPGTEYFGTIEASRDMGNVK